MNFTLTCTYIADGQSAQASVKVMVNPDSTKSGGGGALDFVSLVFIAGIAMLRKIQYFRCPRACVPHQPTAARIVKISWRDF
jgi:hypothetical protein